MNGPSFTHRVQPTPIPLRPDRFEALVAAHEAFAAGRGGRRATLAFIVARRVVCHGRNLADARFDGADFTGASFARSDFSRASFYCANLSDCDFRDAVLTRADLRGCSFHGANLSGANLDEADMRAAVLWARDEAAGFRRLGARAPDAAASPDAVVYGVDFTNCSLQGARLRDANLKNADFSGANLHGAQLAGAKLDGVRLKGAILTGMDVAQLQLPPGALTGCVLEPTEAARRRVDEIRAEIARGEDWISGGGKPPNLAGFDLRPASELFRSRLLAGLQARLAVAVGVDFTGAQLQGANFEGADLRAADFTGADLRGVNFQRANLSHAQLGGATTGELELHEGLRLPTRFDEAVLSGTIFPG